MTHNSSPTEEVSFSPSGLNHCHRQI